ncbi:MAG: transketolase family protein [bacterium]|nr:transketolase family protein [bacterium]
MVATRDAYGKALLKLGEINPKVVVLDADVSSSTRTANFAAKFPERFFNMGIAEANMIGAAAGLATCGKIPFASSFAIFASARCFEQIRNCVCWPRLNVKIVPSHAGISVGEDGASHQAVEDISIMRMLPNMTVIVPADGLETEQAILTAAEYDGPMYIRLGRAKFPLVSPPDYKFSIGKSYTIREGSDATCIAAGLMVFEALSAAEKLQEQGINLRVINMSTIKPIDKEAILKAAEETGAIVTAEEHTIIGGLGSAVAEVLVEEKPVPMKRIGMPDRFGLSGPPRKLLEKFNMSDADIARAVLEVMGRKKL